MRKILSILLACGIVLSFSGCFSNEVKDAGDKVQSAAEDYLEGNADVNEYQNALEDYNDAISGNVKGYDDINEYIEASKKSENYKSMLEGLENSGLKLSLEADGNKLVYKYTYTIEVVENVAQILQDNFKAQDATFESSAKVIKTEAPCVEKVVWEYYTVDGKFIASIEK